MVVLLLCVVSGGVFFVITGLVFDGLTVVLMSKSIISSSVVLSSTI